MEDNQQMIIHTSPNPLDLEVKEQLRAIRRLVPEWAQREARGVAGGKKFVSHDWVRYALDTIFGAQNWSVTLGSHEAKKIENGEMIIITPATLTVRFADGTQATRADIGVAVVRTPRGSDDLAETNTDAYVTAVKASATSAWKGCARDLGNTFSPIQDEMLQASILRAQFEQNIRMAFDETPSPKLDHYNGSEEISEPHAGKLPTHSGEWLGWKQQENISVGMVKSALDGQTGKEWVGTGEGTWEEAAEKVLAYLEKRVAELPA